METRTRVVAVLGAVTVALAVAVPASAEGDDGAVETSAVEQCIEIGLGGPLGGMLPGEGFIDELDLGFAVPPMDADGAADLNDQADELAAFLEERGIAFETYDVSVIGWDPEDPEAAEAIGEFYAEYGLPVPGGWHVPPVSGGFDVFIGEGFPFEFDLDDLPAELEELFGEGLGILDGEFDFENLPEELEELLGGGLFGELGEVFPLDLDVPEEFLAEMQAEIDAVASALAAAGIEYEVVEGPFGGSHVIWDLTNEAANEVVADVYREIYGDDALFRVGPCGDPGVEDAVQGDFDGGWILEEIEMPVLEGGDLDALLEELGVGRPEGAFPGPFGSVTLLGQIDEVLTDGRSG